MRFHLTTLYLVFSFGMACHHTPSDMELFNLIESHCGASEACEVDLSQLTPWEWDKLVVVKMHSLPSQVTVAVGINGYTVPEFEEQLIFLQENDVVKVVKRTYNPEKPYNQTVFFEGIPKGEKILSLSSSEASLKIRREEGSNYKNFYLYESQKN